MKNIHVVFEPIVPNYARGHFVIKVTHVDGSVSRYEYENAHEHLIQQFAERKRRYSTTWEVEVIKIA